MTRTPPTPTAASSPRRRDGPGPGSPPRTPEPEEVLARARLENFPVASRLLGRRVRADLLAIYGFARLVDYAGDEAPGDRLALLDWLERDLERIYRGERPAHPLLVQLAVTVRARSIPPDPFRRLIDANRQDQEQSSYETFDDLLAYCELSANPVGHLVLHVFEAATPDRFRLADLICSGLQVTEHLQDVAEDLASGRVYLPREDMGRFGVRPGDLAHRPTPHPVRELIALETGRARSLLERGAPLARSLPPRQALAVAAFVAGGLAALRGIERCGYCVATEARRPSWAQRAGAMKTTMRRALER